MDLSKNNLNKEIVATLYNSFPQTKNLAHYLMEILDMGRESVYRRIRSEVPFTFDEICIIASKLNLSIDRIIGTQTPIAYLDMHLYQSRQPIDIFREIFEANIEWMEDMLSKEDLKLYAILNRLPLGYTIRHEQLGKFNYYKWFFHTQKDICDYSFENFVVPDQIWDIYKKFIKYSDLLGNEMSLIIDENIFIFALRDINYFLKRGLINNSALQLIQQELLQIVDSMETLARNATTSSGANVRFYLSSVDIEPNYSYMEHKNGANFYIWSPAGEIVKCSNPVFCSRQKDWITSLIRYTTLISQCNEIQQLDFFNLQRKYIKNMVNKPEEGVTVHIEP